MASRLSECCIEHARPLRVTQEPVVFLIEFIRDLQLNLPS
jgi:hypothetical protein